MSVIGSNILAGASGQGGDYTIARSLRFRSSASAYLNRTFGTPTNNKIWTYSVWLKHGKIGAEQELLNANSVNAQFYFSSSDTLNFYDATAGATYNSTQVFRDPSAWYHIVLAVDTTQATAGNRVRIYVNGSQITAFSTGTAPTQNNASAFNIASTVHTIGRYNPTTTNYLDGYLTEVNFIDGQALTPSSFGATNASTGVWQPKKYAGTYGTNGFYLPFNINTTATYGGYVTDLSSNYVSLPTGSQGSNFTFSGDFTIEGWVNYPSASGDGSLYVSNSGSDYFALNIDMSAGNYNIYCNSGSPTATISHGMSPNRWNHVAMVRSGSTITLYTNGVAKGTISNSSTLGFSTLSINRFGGGASGARYLSNVRITKSAVYTSGFTPSSSPLTNIANTVCLTYQNATPVDNSSNGYTLTQTGTTTFSIQYPFSTNSSVANDQSGQGNNWTTNNISLVNGSTYDSMTDVPTLTSATAANFAVMNPLDQAGGLIFSEANLKVTASTGWDGARATFSLPSTGKYYWETTCISRATGAAVGILGTSAVIVGDTANAATGYVYNSGDGQKYNNGSASAYGATWTTNDNIGISWDADAGTLVFYKNGTSQGTAWTGLSGTFSPAIGVNGSDSMNANFGQRPFAYTPPTGFVALNTFNLPTPTIGATASTQANKYFDATLYTGTGSALTVTNAGSFQPDLVWVKNRSAGDSSGLYDAIRGVNQRLISNSTGAEDTSSGVSAFNSNGFSLGTAANYNTNGNSFVGWQWKGANGSVSNTAGSITSTVSANTSAGFSVVTYTGNGGSSATVGHGLGVAPKMIIVKSRSNAIKWGVYHTSIGNTKMAYLNETSVPGTSSVYWNNTNPSSTVFTIGNGDEVGINGATYVAYCFSEILGFSKMGSYTGITGNADSSFIYTGFKPAFVLIKRTDSTGYWVMLDNKRKTYNVNDAVLYANASNAEATGQSIDFLSNGFKLRTTDSDVNSSGTYIYYAVAENPFKYSLGR